MLKKLLLIFLLLSISNSLFSQITISSPVLRQVFQRDLNKQALVTITGSYSQPIDTIQVRFTPVKIGQGELVDWTVIKSAPLGGLFKGNVVVKGGWYTMEVKGLLGGKIVGNISTLSRVGVGEVFVIAGQSNAGGSGLLETNETGATDDRVNCANFISPRSYFTNSPFFHADLAQFSIIEFSQLKKTSAIGPAGLGPYYWGKVGDALAAKENVPVMFFNAGWAGASVRVWRESAENPTIGVPSDFQFDPNVTNRYDVGYPYANFNATLRYYGVNLGIRAILWMEGETANLLNLSATRNNKPLPVTEANYLDNLQRLIKKTRQDLGNNKLAWVVARTSYSGDLDCKVVTTPLPPPPAPSPIIVSAQNKAITDKTLSPMFPGPFTDNIQTTILRERDQCVHFTGNGLDDVAAAWIKTLTDKNNENKSFFDLIEPILADTIPNVSLECISSSQLKLSLPDGYAGYEWVSTGNGTIVGKTKSISVGSGEYIARVTRSNGNIVQVPRFTVKANAPAKAPIITAANDLNFCLGTSVFLQSSTEADNPIYEWTSSSVIANLPRTKDIAVSREATYKLRVIDKNACASPYSAEVKLVAKSRPEKPSVATSGSTEFCDGQSIVLTSSNVGASSYLWKRNEENISENTQVIVVKRMGNYSVQTRASNGCLSDSLNNNNISVIVNPLPATPQISALADTVFCEGGNVTLVSTPSDDNNNVFGWNRNNVDDKIIHTSTLKVFDTELARGFVTDNKNCSSKLSNAIQVVRKDNPMIITVIQKGTYTLVARADKSANEYTWKFNDKTLSVNDTIIRATDEGKYSVIGKNVYKVKSTASLLTCLSAESSYDLKLYDDKGISVYPNPSTGVFTLESRYDLDKVVITIYTMDGRLIQEGKIDFLNSQKVLDSSKLTEDMYILRVESSSFKISKLIRLIR